MRIGTPEIVILLVIVVLLFGVGRISKIGKELGAGLRAFRDEMKSPDDSDQPASQDDKPGDSLR
ncbi:MAG TPA: twin-arginine translocase TatA/TatE family subunit [Anaerolineaceae bacterium]